MLSIADIAMFPPTFSLPWRSLKGEIRARLISSSSRHHTTRVSPSALPDLTPIDVAAFRFFTDANRSTQPVPHVDLSVAGLANGRGNPHPVPFFTDKLFHKAHCLHTWELQAHALRRAGHGEKGVWVFDRAMAWDHTRHCHEMLYDPEWDWEGAANLFPRTGNCVQVSWNSKPMTGSKSVSQTWRW